MRQAKRLGFSVVGASLLAVLVLADAGVGSGSPGKAGTTVITMERDGRELFFDGPATVEAGSTLKIKNNTNPRQIGPHTFSFAKSKFFPKSNKAIKRCGRKLTGICGAIIGWHEVDLDSGQVTENPVEVGKNGWDRVGTLKRKGDSWVSERKNQTFSREVTAKPGKTLAFICAVHPEMQGEITVTD